MPVITKPCFIKYHEGKVGKTEKNLIINQCHLIQAAYSICTNLSFTKRQIQSTLRQIAEAKSFFEDPDDLADWVKTCADRLRYVFRDYQQALTKARGHSTSWVSLVLPMVLTCFATTPLQ